MKNIFATALITAAASAQEVTLNKPFVSTDIVYDSFNVDLTPATDGSDYEVGNLFVYVDGAADVQIPQSLAFALNSPFTVISQEAFAEATSWTFSAGDEDIDPDFTGPSGTGQLCILVSADYRCTTN